MPIVSVSGAAIHYRVHSGAVHPQVPPLLLVHGAGGNHMHWPGDLRRLPGATVYALDLPGHGDSGGAGRADIGEYAEEVRGFADALNLPRFVLAGHSMGGAISLEFALRYPKRLAGLVLVGTGAKLAVSPVILNGLRDNPAQTAELLAEWTHAEAADPNMLRLYVRRLREIPAEVVYGDFAACDAFDRRADIHRITAPTLILCGEADKMTPVKYSRYLQEQIRGSELVVISGAGHMVMLERPGQVADAVAGFLNRLV
jgi:pimeloyl-ACP methyl ester carboxylesterase